MTEPAEGRAGGAGDLVLAGEVFTGDERGRVEALAIVAGRVAAAGSLAEAVAAAPPGTPVRGVDLALPGFVDSHVHALWLGRAQHRLGLDHCRSVAELCAAIAEWAARLEPGEWVLGNAGLDEGDLAENRLPTIEELDAAASGHPLFLDRRAHDALVNTAALERAGVTGETPDPPGGRVERRADGSPTGLLRERPAAALVEGAVPPPTTAEMRRWIASAQRTLLAAGVTSLSDPALSVDEIAGYVDAARRGELRVRTVVFPLGGEGVDPEGLWARAEATGIGGIDPEVLRLGPIKLFLDGAGGLGTALRREPWPGTDSPGIQVTPSETLAAYAAWAWRAGRGVAVHAVGPRAVEIALDAFEAASAGERWRPGRVHLIHAYFEQEPEVMRRSAGLGVGVSVHPALHANARGGIVARFGPAGAEKIVRVADWLATGALVGGGSDGPGCALEPLTAIRGLVPEIGMDAALRFFTGDAAALTGAAAGALAPGAPADVLLAERDADGGIVSVEVLRSLGPPGP